MLDHPHHQTQVESLLSTDLVTLDQHPLCSSLAHQPLEVNTGATLRMWTIWAGFTKKTRHTSGATQSLEKGVRNVALSLAMIPSHSAAEVTVAPMAGPLAATRIGLGKSRKRLKSFSLLSVMSVWRVLIWCCGQWRTLVYHTWGAWGWCSHWG